MAEEYETYRHPTLPIRASKDHWRAAGYSVYSNTDEVGCQDSPARACEELLLIALANGLSDEHAIAWALTERNRRGEERTRSTAQARLAEAITALAASIKPLNVRVLIERLVPSLPLEAQQEVRRILRD